MAWGDILSTKSFESCLLRALRYWHRSMYLQDFQKDHDKFIETRKTAEEIRALTDSLRDSLLEMHKKVTSTASDLEHRSEGNLRTQVAKIRDW